MASNKKIKNSFSNVEKKDDYNPVVKDCKVLDDGSIELTNGEVLTKDDFYSLDRIMSENEDYYLIVGQRSNGKTHACLTRALYNYLRLGKRFIYMRKWVEDITTRNCSTAFDRIPVDKIFGEGYHIKFRNGTWTLYNEVGEKVDDIGYAVALNQVGHLKSTTFAEVKTIIFDEFIDMAGTRKLSYELSQFENLINTITRIFDGFEIFLLANTVSRYSPYFVYFDTNIRKIKQGEIVRREIVTDMGVIRVALEYCKYNPKIGNQTSRYTRSRMITKGEWEIAPVDEIPTALNEITKDKLLFSCYDPTMMINLGVFLRRATWSTIELSKNGLSFNKIHEREFLVILETDRESSYYHLTNEKDLSYTRWHLLKDMLADILEKTDIDVINEIKMGRVFCQDEDVADYFYNCWQKYSNTNIRELL